MAYILSDYSFKEWELEALDHLYHCKSDRLILRAYDYKSADRARRHLFKLADQFFNVKLSINDVGIACITGKDNLYGAPHVIDVDNAN